jgi:hypothetical protein
MRWSMRLRPSDRIPIAVFVFAASCLSWCVDEFHGYHPHHIAALLYQRPGMRIAPAGDMTEGTGHHHLLIDARDIDTGVVIPNDNQHKHFGKGQTESQVFLQPGRYRLTMQFADGAHRSYGEGMRKSINITVAGEK